MIFKAPAKINLALDVLGLRPDGYHDIDIVSLPLELHDSIEIEEYPERFGTYLTSDDTSLVCDESNLVYVAYRAMKRAFGLHSGFRIKIYKKIPMEAGLAGGSADAAAVINGLVKMKKLTMTDQQKIDMAKVIGSDVPYCLFNKPSRIQGMGEKLTLINTQKTWGVLLVKPEQGLSTKEVYKVSDTYEKDKPDIPSLIKGLETGKEAVIQKNMGNGLQKAAIHLLPEIGNLIERLKAEGLDKVMMSGSGSTVYALSEDIKKLEQVGKKFDDDTHYVWVTKTAL
ncbi:MAG: 4-(cytidine 5'-diphospho)-2-C-methyl-D-erythritol kinase [Bacilli bacterium]|jgi:4-diphosphocytidyl-2C-methyl-D-erythritol kinase|nr:4-(cytidine 5'-diphospho)-2-C-methyl-D-erythritol kinase [Bacilli bacterium]